MIYLIGYMGSGKTTIGKHLSKKLNMPFIDTDKLIESESKKSINCIFHEFGEDYLKVAEALLKQRMECRIGIAISALENIQNIPLGGLDHEVLMQSDTSLLRADWIEVMNKMLGDRPIFYSPRKMDFDNE